MKAFPDRDETPLLQLTGQSGAMGSGVNLNRILRLSVCPSGLRVGAPRFLIPFSRDFLVPWDEISATRKHVLFMQAVELRLGHAGKLTISEALAGKLASAAGGHWPKAS